jgi:hypothetical protein
VGQGTCPCDPAFAYGHTFAYVNIVYKFTISSYLVKEKAGIGEGCVELVYITLI